MSVSSLLDDNSDKSWANLYVDSMKVFNDLTVCGNFIPEGGLDHQNINPGANNTFLHTNPAIDVVWEPLDSAIGDKGDKGDVGPPGPQGIQGQPGQQGDKGEVISSDVIGFSTDSQTMTFTGPIVGPTTQNIVFTTTHSEGYINNFSTLNPITVPSSGIYTVSLLLSISNPAGAGNSITSFTSSLTRSSSTGPFLFINDDRFEEGQDATRSASTTISVTGGDIITAIFTVSNGIGAGGAPFVNARLAVHKIG